MSGQFSGLFLREVFCEFFGCKKVTLAQKIDCILRVLGMVLCHMGAFRLLELEAVCTLDGDGIRLDGQRLFAS